MPTLRFRAIVPKGMLVDLPQLRREFPNALNHGIAIIRDDYARTTRTWRQSPIFRIKRATARAAALVASVSTDNEIYGYVERGTRPHLIRPKRARLLSFRAGYRAKTRPGVVGSRAGGPRGPRVFAKAVRHPGTKARNFTPLIVKRRERNVLNLLRAAHLRSLRSRRKR